MLGDCNAIQPAQLEGAHRKSVAKIVDTRVTPCIGSSESGAIEELQKTLRTVV